MDNVRFSVLNFSKFEENLNLSESNKTQEDRHLQKSFKIPDLFGPIVPYLLRVKRNDGEPDSKGRTKAPPLSSKEEKLMESKETNAHGEI